MILNLLLSLNILVCLCLIGVVLLQRSEGGALGSGGGPTGLITTRGAGDLLTRITWILFSVFLLLSMTLTLLGGQIHSSKGLMDRLRSQSVNPGAVTPPPAAPTLPSAPLPAGLSPDALNGQLTGPQAPAPLPAAPAPTAAPSRPTATPTAPAASTASRPAPTRPARAATTAPAAAAPAAPAEAPPPVITAPPPAPRVDSAPAPLNLPRPPAPKPADPDAPVRTTQP